jgi:hypothetical protein
VTVRLRSLTARRLASLTAPLLVIAGLLAQAPPAASRVAGRVVDGSNRAVRGALVMIAGTDIAVARVTATSDDGTFVFDAVPAGHVLVVAGKPTYLAGLYGAARAGRPGEVVSVGTGRTTDLVVALQKGASITGRVLDGNGQPVVGARVRVTPRRLVGLGVVIGGDVGEPAIVTTDETGAYRVFDLAPGDYLVGVAARVFAPGDAIIDGSPQSQGPVPSAQGASVGYAPAYYPAATQPEDAAVVTLEASTDRAGVDIRTTVVRLARVEGVLTGVDGVMPANQILIRPRGWTTSGAFLSTQTTRAGADGRFTFPNVPPAAYPVLAPTLPPPPDPLTGVTRRALPLWAMADITLSGADDHVVLRWQAGLTVSGRVTFAGMAHPPTDITVRVAIRPTPATAGSLIPDPVPIDAAGRFTIGGVVPGEYWLAVQVPADPATQLPDWIPGSAMIDGHDAFDDAFAVRADLGMPDIPVVLTRETQQIDGGVRDGAGRPVVDCPVVVFSTDRRFWFPQSRHIAVRRTDATGGLLFNLAAALPPGEYYVAAAPDLGPGEQFDPVLLADATASARRVTVPLGGSQTVRIRLGRRP